MKHTRSILFILLILAVSSSFAAENAETGKLFRYQFRISDPSFCSTEVCVDLDNDGRREISLATRSTKNFQMLNASDGRIIWSANIGRDSQSTCAYDLDEDGSFEIIYTTSGPGGMYVLDKNGVVLKSWNCDDWKLGNSPVIIDGDGDGILDGYFGSRSKYLFRLNMQSLAPIKQRDGWIQCGCHTSAMDVDRDGRWELFAGSGDDSNAKGVLHCYDPVTLETIWFYKTDDNASSADPVLVDIDNDGQVEVVKSVDNYGGDDAHDGIYAFRFDGRLLWRFDGVSGEDSPNIADLDGDGYVEIVGMTFGSEVYCLDANGGVKWRRDLRPELTDKAHAYMTPILCDVDGDRELEILAMTNDRWDGEGHAILFALSAAGEILDEFDMGAARYLGHAFYCNIDDDPYMELVMSGQGGLDVLETRGFGANTEYFQRRRSYQRLNVYPWAYEDSYFIYRGKKSNVGNLTDNLVLKKIDGSYTPNGSFTTELLTLPPNGFFDRLSYKVYLPIGTDLQVNILDQAGTAILKGVGSGTRLDIQQPVRLEFVFSTTNNSVTPVLDSYRLSFDLKYTIDTRL